jgi:hypothetical protein
MVRPSNVVCPHQQSREVLLWVAWIARGGGADTGLGTTDIQIRQGPIAPFEPAA